MISEDKEHELQRKPLSSTPARATGLRTHSPRTCDDLTEFVAFIMIAQQICQANHHQPYNGDQDAQPLAQYQLPPQEGY